MHNLTHQTRTIPLTGYVAAGTDGARVDLTEIDMRGFSGFRICASIGTVTATGQMAIYAKNSSTSATYGSGTVDDIGSNTGNTSNRIVIAEFYRPKERYVKPQYQRTTANVVINAIWAELFNPDDAPVEQLTTHVDDAPVFYNNPTPSET
ncbi:MAG: hypothetical protein JST51_01510 [Armatimonadetes bacterium]|nr:hypothetical protein [Armatimonadota bacterium]